MTKLSKLHRLVIPIKNAILDVISLLNQINTPSGTECAATELMNAFSSIHLRKNT